MSLSKTFYAMLNMFSQWVAFCNCLTTGETDSPFDYRFGNLSLFLLNLGGLSLWRILEPRVMDSLQIRLIIWDELWDRSVQVQLLELAWCSSFLESFRGRNTANQNFSCSWKAQQLQFLWFHMAAKKNKSSKRAKVPTLLFHVDFPPINIYKVSLQPNFKRNYLGNTRLHENDSVAPDSCIIQSREKGMNVVVR